MRVTRSIVTLLVVAMCTAGLSASAGAAERSLARCIGPGGAPAMTSVRLTRNLTCSMSDGIDVGRSGITIDLNGHTLTGAGLHEGVSVPGFSGVTVKNGTIKAFADGVNSTGTHLRVTRVHANGNANYGIYDNAAFGRVSASTATGNTGPGVAIFGTNGVIQGTKAVHNGSYGLYINGNSGRIIHSRAVRNTSFGVYISGNDGRITSTRAVNGSDYGLYINGDNGVVSHSVSAGNAGFGIYVTGGVPHVISSRSSNNMNYDIYVSATTAGALVRSSTAIGGTSHGIYVIGANTVVSHSRAIGTGANGIYLAGDGAKLTSSKAIGNGWSGIFVLGDAPVIGSRSRRDHRLRNIANGNGTATASYGIFAAGFVTPPVGHNTAKHNHTPVPPTQCNPTALC